MKKKEIMNDPNKTIPSRTLAMKSFLIEFETLAINMLKTHKKIFSASKLTKIFEEIEQDFIHGRQWDCSSVVDLFLTKYEHFINYENLMEKTKQKKSWILLR